MGSVVGLCVFIFTNMSCVAPQCQWQWVHSHAMKAQERTLCPLLYEYEYTQTGPRGWVTSARHHFTACARVQAYCNTTCDMCTGETKEKLSLSLSLYIYIYIYIKKYILIYTHFYQLIREVPSYMTICLGSTPVSFFVNICLGSTLVSFVPKKMFVSTLVSCFHE